MPQYTPDQIQRASRMLKILAEPTRLSILLLLEKQKLSVSEIAAKLNLEQSKLSHHLMILRQERLASSTVDGKSRIYEPYDDHIYEVLQQVMEHIDEPHPTPSQEPKQEASES